MTDVFISYAHEDHIFVSKLAKALEAEGLSVWWDHTIPPGKTWNTFIARGIEQAKACLVIWSRHSVASKWVLEEASLANDAEKLLPIAVDGSPPPMGFRSLQAAQLASWNGDRSNPQFQLLVREARALSGNDAPPPPRQSYAAPRPASASSSPSGAPRPALIGAVLAGLAVLAVTVFVLTRPPAPNEVAQTPAEILSPAQGEADLPTAADGYNPAELERLRRERDQAVESARSQQAENERLRSAQTAQTQPAASNVSAALVGSWSMQRNWNRPANMAGITGNDGVTLNADGTASGPGYNRWSVNGSEVRIFADSGVTNYVGVYNGTSVSGTVEGSSGAGGTFTMTRN